MIIKKLQAADQEFLKEMFYKALYVPEGEDPYPRSIIDRPDLAKYYLHWGKDTDIGFYAEMDGEKVGAIWSRFFTKENKGYGFVSEEIPEIGIALKEDFRGRGIGSRLIQTLLEEAKRRNIRAVSLSADPRNRAVHSYERFGFIVMEKEETALLMKKVLH